MVAGEGGILAFGREGTITILGRVMRKLLVPEKMTGGKFKDAQPGCERCGGKQKESRLSKTTFRDQNARECRRYNDTGLLHKDETGADYGR